MKIFLVGFMGSGKSYVGRHLAPLMNFSFIDMDHFIERKEEQPISQIFAGEGESHFREIERKALEGTQDFHRFIIGTGGGAPCFFDNMDWMNNNGLTVYLKTPEETIFERLIKKRAHRPLVARLTDQQLKNYIHEKIQERAAFYESAQIIYERKYEEEDVVANLQVYLGPSFG